MLVTMVGDALKLHFPRRFPSWGQFSFPPFAQRSSKDAQEAHGSLLLCGKERESGCAGDALWLLSWGARDGVRPAVVPPPAPSWQLPLNLPFIACQKASRAFCSPPCPLILTFIIHQADAYNPLHIQHHRDGEPGSCVGVSGGGSALPPMLANPQPQMLSGAVGFIYLVV